MARRNLVPTRRFQPVDFAFAVTRRFALPEFLGWAHADSLRFCARTTRRGNTAARQLQVLIGINP